MADKEFTRATGKGFSDINPQSGSPKAPGLKDLVELFDFGTKAAFRPARFVGPIESVGLHKVKIKKKDGEVIEIQKPCLAFDRKKGVLDSTKVKKCPYCQMGAQQYLAVRFFSNVIDRDAQEAAPKKIKPHTKEELTSGFRSIDSEAYSPIKVLGMPSSLTKRIKEIDERNLKKGKDGKKHYEIRDPDHGVDVELKFNKKEQAANMYSAVKSDDGMTALTKEERKYLLWDLSVIYPKEAPEMAKKEAESMATRMPDDIAKEMKKAGKGKESSNSSAADSSSGSGSDSASEDSGKKSKSKAKDKKKSNSDSSSESASESSSESKNSSDSASDASTSSSNSGSDSASSSKSDSSDGGKAKKGSKDKAKSSAKSSKSKTRSGKGKSADSDSGSASESVSTSSALSASGKKSKKKSSKSASDSGSDLSGLDSDSSGSASASSDSDKKAKSKKKK